MTHPPLHLPAALRAAIIAHARSEFPNECCGLLAGRIESDRLIAERHYPLVNQLESTERYFAEPRSLFAAFKQLRADQWDLLAIYHSHPTSPAIPSRHDLNHWHYENAIMLIMSLENDLPRLNGWWIEGGLFREAIIC